MTSNHVPLISAFKMTFRGDFIGDFKPDMEGEGEAQVRSGPG